MEYIHEKGESGGSFSFKFNLEDPEGNRVIGQSFFISVLGEPRSNFGTLKDSCSGMLEESYFSTFSSFFSLSQRTDFLPQWWLIRVWLWMRTP